MNLFNNLFKKNSKPEIPPENPTKQEAQAGEIILHTIEVIRHKVEADLKSNIFPAGWDDIKVYSLLGMQTSDYFIRAAVVTLLAMKCRALHALQVDAVGVINTINNRLSKDSLDFPPVAEIFSEAHNLGFKYNQTVPAKWSAALTRVMADLQEIISK